PPSSEINPPPLRAALPISAIGLAKWKDAAATLHAGLLARFCPRPEPSFCEPAELAKVSPVPRWPTQTSPPLKGRPQLPPIHSTLLARISTLIPPIQSTSMPILPGLPGSVVAVLRLSYSH